MAEAPVAPTTLGGGGGFLRGLGELKKVVFGKSAVFASLAVVFVASLLAMGVSAYCADQISKSSCGATDEKAKLAYKASMGTAVICALLAIAAVAGVAFTIWKSKKLAKLV